MIMLSVCASLSVTARPSVGAPRCLLAVAAHPALHLSLPRAVLSARGAWPSGPASIPPRLPPSPRPGITLAHATLWATSRASSSAAPLRRRRRGKHHRKRQTENRRQKSRAGGHGQEPRQPATHPFRVGSSGHSSLAPSKSKSKTRAAQTPTGKPFRDRRGSNLFDPVAQNRRSRPAPQLPSLMGVERLSSVSNT